MNSQKQQLNTSLDAVTPPVPKAIKKSQELSLSVMEPKATFIEPNARCHYHKK
jgi:hypothetical protein